jgi:hypothetical protein
MDLLAVGDIWGVVYLGASAGTYYTSFHLDLAKVCSRSSNPKIKVLA